MVGADVTRRRSARSGISIEKSLLHGTYRAESVSPSRLARRGSRTACFCFDVHDEVELNLKDGERWRRWDSCQLDEFARVAGGENFREHQAARLRHRFMRKGRYLMEKYGELGCVGCGRCARSCLVDISPVQVFNELHGHRV